ncbi:MAG: exodeoxyribonuclease V subunit gamma [Clostridia bacterium]|nr:exodeoxyribonuclease V subunit gamma [Clostridia bacterium]
MNTVIKAFTLSECMEVMAEYAEAYEKQGGKNLIFCEDRLTLIAERTLARRLGGTFETNVTTFARFLKTNGRTLSKQGSVMAVGDVMTRLQRENVLQCFTTASGVGNNAKSIYETLAQFAASEVTPEVLWESVALLPDDTLKKKTADLARIYEAYDTFLREHSYLDENRYLSLLPAQIRADATLRDTNVFFLCYNSFTAQAMRTVAAALDTAKNVVGVFCSDDKELYQSRAKDLFLRACEKNGKTRELALGTPLDGEAEILRRGLFNPERMEGGRIKTDNIRIFEAEDKTEEAEHVAVQIRKAMAENETLRYRDFALLVPDIAAYSLPIKRALGEYGIPYFIDEKRSLKRHPLGRFLLDCFKVVKENFSPSAVQSLAGNPFFGESDEYRNYLFKFANYRGGAKKEIKTGEAVESIFSLNALNAGRERLLTATKNIKAKGQGREYCLAVRKILVAFEAEKQLAELEARIEDVSQKSYLSQIYRALEQVLEEAELLTGENELSVAEFAAVLQDGLDATEISLIPVKADAVFIGDITQSKIEKVHTLFALGMTDAVPHAASDTAIISDKDIERLAAVKTLLEPTVAEVNLRSRESAGLNLCTFLDKLFLSYPLSSDGDEPALSEVFRYVDVLFCTSQGKDIPRCGFDETDLDYLKYQCSAPTPAIRRLLLEKAAIVESAGKKTPLAQERYNSLYTALDKLSVTEKDEFLEEYKGQVCVERGEELFFHDGKISPTALEGYFECPFRHFAERGLRLKEREETAVLSLDTGNFIHELLETTVQRMPQIETEEAMRAYAMAVGAEILKKPVYASQQDTASGVFFSEKLLAEGAEVVLGAYRQLKNSAFCIEDTERTVDTGAFKGKVDRVDSAENYVRVIDYKTGSIDDSATSYYTGRKLQMQLYMSGIKGERIPAGVFYFPASVDYTDEETGRFRMKGFLNGNEAALRLGDKGIEEKKQSDYFPAALTNPRSKRVMKEDVFCDFIDYAPLVATQAYTELKDGFIAPTPYSDNCEYCKYGGACSFNKDKYSSRKEVAIEPSGIAKVARCALGKEEPETKQEADKDLEK